MKFDKVNGQVQLRVKMTLRRKFDVVMYVRMVEYEADNADTLTALAALARHRFVQIWQGGHIQSTLVSVRWLSLVVA